MASTRRAAAIAGVHPDTIRRWIRQGKLQTETRQVGHVLAKMVDVAEVERLASQITAGRPPKDGRNRLQ